MTYIWVHAVWTPKKRKPILVPEMRGPLFIKIKQIAQEKGYFIDTLNGLDDHLHLLIKMNSSQSIGKIIKDLKGASSRWINEQGKVPGAQKDPALLGVVAGFAGCDGRQIAGQ